jgi:hypothetical protein
MEQNKTYYISKEDYLTLKAHWSKHYWQSGAKEMIIYNILRSKPARNGFVEKKRNIQGNNPWFAFENACNDALSYTIEKYEKIGFFGARFTSNKEDYLLSKKEYLLEKQSKLRERFLERFGIEPPEGLYSKLHDALDELKNENG